MSGDRIRLGAWLRRLAHPRSWPVRWRLAAVSSGLTFVILVLFGGAIGQIATQRIRNDFTNQIIVATDDLAARLDVQLNASTGTLVRVSFWVKVPVPVQAAADGLVVFDSAGGEPLGVRVRYQPNWKQYNLYRRVPADGKVSMTFALTGFGTAYIDDVKIEPMLPAG